SLSKVALTKEAQLKEVRKKSMRDFRMTHPSNSGKVTKIPPSAAKIKPSVTNEGTCAKLGVPNNEEEVKDDDEHEGEFVITPSNYTPTDDEDEINVESNDDDNAEGDEDKGMDDTTNLLYDDVDVRLNDPVHADEGFVQKEDAEIVSLIDFHVQHDVPSSQIPTLLTVPVMVIIESSPIYTTTIPQSSPSFTPSLPQSTPTPPPTNEATDPQFALLDFASVFQFNNRVSALKKAVSKLRKDDPLKTKVTALVDDHLDSRLRATRDEFMSYLSASITARITEQIKSYELNKSLFSTYDKVYSLKRSRKDKDKDEDPFAGSDRELKKRKTSKDVEPTKGPKTKESKSGHPKAPSLNQHLLKMTRFDVMRKHGLTNISGDDVSDFSIALRMFTRSLVIQKRFEDLQLGVKSYPKKINVTKPKTTRPDIRKRDPYTPYQDPQGFIYVDTQGRNRLMLSHKLYKFGDGTLTRLRASLEDITKNITMEYLPKRR
nr:hypothetical protein [Tanacetum cinerariifolium]